MKEYRLEAITGGSDALAQAIIKVEDAKGTAVSAAATREDVVVASVEAMVGAINKILLRRKLERTTETTSMTRSYSVQET